MDVKQIIDITDKLPKNPKGSWETMPLRRKDGTMRAGLREQNEITHISVHHTGVDGSPAGHANFHIRKGDGGIAYHVLIEKDQIYQVNNLLALTWHTQSNNYHTIGISVEGNFTKRDLTQKERDCLYAAILTVMNLFDIPVRNVLGHHEFPGCHTSCPGFSMQRVRTDLTKMKMEMDYRNSDLYSIEAAAKVRARIEDLYNKLNGPYREHALKHLTAIGKFMDDAGISAP